MLASALQSPSAMGWLRPSHRPSLRQSVVGPWAAAALLAVGAAAHAAPDASFRTSAEQRPADLVVLRRWGTIGGEHLIGVHDAKPDPRDPSARTIVLWLESPTGVELAVDTLRCSPEAPMRLTLKGDFLEIRELNPGGPVTAANRLDHQIWWAACHPAQAGKDPAQLTAVARQLGYSGKLREQQQLVPRHPR
jgi:hypothetical protein